MAGRVRTDGVTQSLVRSVLGPACQLQVRRLIVISRASDGLLSLRTLHEESHQAHSKQLHEGVLIRTTAGLSTLSDLRRRS